ncbi:MAG TPA: LysM peptidoglycan-binding domain-containing protein [Tissierellia bacterium]|nr:LysM peptidoglycan-binding domain-containing protein [Tissierellia bacterium]
MSANHDDRQGGKRCPAGSFPYTIKSGDTLYFLAIRFNTTVEAIMNLNPGIDPNNLQIGQVICIPEQKVSPLPPCPHGFYYTIRQGDTIFLLSQRFGVSVEAILMANPGIDPNNLQIGQVICIPTMPSPEPELPPCPYGVYYRVKPGDTFFLLAQKFCVTVQALMMANPGVDPNNLMIGQILCIPKRCVIFCD